MEKIFIFFVFFINILIFQSYAQSDFVFYEYATCYSINSNNDQILIGRNEKIYRRYVYSSDKYEYKTEDGLLVEKRNDIYVADYNTRPIYTINNEKIIVQSYVSENGECSGDIYLTESGEEVIQFNEYGVMGDTYIKYRTNDQSQPMYSIFLTDYSQKIELVHDISGSQVIIPEYSFTSTTTEEKDVNHANNEFKYWKLVSENAELFYYPGDIITIPNRDISLTAIFEESPIILSENFIEQPDNSHELPIFFIIGVIVVLLIVGLIILLIHSKRSNNV